MTPPHPLKGTVTMPTAEAAELIAGSIPSVPPAPPARQTETKTEPSSESVPGLAKASAWADSVRQAPPAEREEMIIIEVSRGIVEHAKKDVALGQLGRLAATCVDQNAALGRTLGEMQTVLGETLTQTREQREDVRDLKVVAREAHMAAAGAIDMVEEHVVSSSAPGVTPSGRPLSQRALRRQQLVDAEMASSRPAAVAPAAPPKPALTRGQWWATRAFEGGCVLVLWAIYKIFESFTLHYLEHP